MFRLDKKCTKRRVPGEVPGKVFKYSEGKVIYRAQSIKSPNHFNKQLTLNSRPTSRHPTV